MDSCSPFSSRKPMKWERDDSPKRSYSRHRSSTPEDNMPSLSPKTYKYICSSAANKYYSSKDEVSINK